MFQMFDMTTLITLAVAVVVLLRLRSVLGKRTGHQRPPFEMDRRESQNNDSTNGNAENDNVVSLPKRSKKSASKSGSNASSSESIPNKEAIDAYAKPNTKLNRGLREVAKNDPAFTPDGFLGGAKLAYEMIVTAFADGDRKALKGLLSREVYDGFASAISDREKKGEKISSTFVGIENAKVNRAEINDNDAHVTVQFISQTITSTTNSEGKVIDGDAEQVGEVNDIWTFARDIRSRDPNWKLVATESDS